MSHRHLFLSVLILSVILACSSKPEPGTAVVQVGKTASLVSSTNYLNMKINGVEWRADNDIFGAFHPKGYNKAIVISGSKGPKDKNQQTFSLNLYNTEGPGNFQIQTGNVDLSVAQLGNLTPQNYLYGSLMGFNIKVRVTKASAAPDEIEATFEGELTGNAGDVLHITEGKFYYHE